MIQNRVYQLCLLCLLLFAGCADEDFFRTTFGKGDHTLTATIEGQEIDAVSRAAVDESGQVTWITTDVLGVFATHTENAKFTSTGSGASVVFRGDLSSGDEVANWAYYPYDPDAEVNNKTLSFSLPSEYTYTGNNNAPMIGVKNDDGTFQFKHLCGLLRITLGGGMPEGADRFIITSVGENAPVISGTATVQDITANDVVLAIATNGCRSITYTLDNLTSTGTYQSFFVPLPTGLYPKLQVSFYLKGKTEPEFTRTLSGLRVNRAVMTSLPILDWKTGEQFVLSENTKEITVALAKQVSIDSDDNTTLIYRVSSVDNVPKVGNIVWSRVTDAFPYGFLGKVTNVTANKDGSYTVETGVAALNEAFDELYVDETVVLQPEEETARSRTETMKVFGFDLNMESSLKIGVEGNPFYLSGSAGLGYNLTTTIILDKKRKIERAEISLTQVSDLDFKVGMEGNLEKEEEKPLAKLKLKSIPLAYGIIQLTPELDLTLVTKVSGGFENEIGFKSKILSCAGAEYKNGKWEIGQNKRNQLKNESPWNLSGKLAFGGQISVGIAAGCNFKLYNREKMKIGISPEIDGNLKGEIYVDETNSESLEKILKNAYLSTFWTASAKIEVDASLLSPKDQLKKAFAIPEVSFAEKPLYLFPFFKDLLASVNAKEQTETLQAKIATEVSREMLSKDTRIAIEVKDQQGEVVKTTSPVPYTGSTKDEVVEDNETTGKAADPEPVVAEIDDIQAGETYEAYPVIYSPLLEDIVPEGKLELKDQTVTFTAPASFRDQLVQLYKDTNGDNWTHNDNWCSNKPLSEWYGIIYSTDACQIDLSNNNLIGSFRLSNSKLFNLNVEGNNLTSINLSDCINLQYLQVGNNKLTSINLSNCTNIEDANTWDNENLETIVIANCVKLKSIPLYDYQKLVHLDAHGCVALTEFDMGYNKTLKYLDLSDCVEIVQDGAIWYNCAGLKTLKLKNCTKLTELMWNSGAPLDTLDLTGCTNLQEVSALNMGDGNVRQLKWVSLADCKSLNKAFLDSDPYNTSDKHPIEYLDISCITCPNIRVSLTERLHTLKANEAEVKGLYLRTCSNIKQLELNKTKFQILDVSGWQITSLDMISFPEFVTELYISSCPISSLNTSLYPSLTKLSCERTKISSLDVTCCPNISTLYCSDNVLSSLNVSNCKKLNDLHCGKTGIHSLNLFGCTNLENLFCEGNQLTALDLSACDASLNILYCSDNKLSSLYVSSCTNLISLGCENNQLSTLDVSKNTNLTGLGCGNNQLSTLDISKNTNLTILKCESNQLTSLDVSKNTLLENIDCKNNQLTSLDFSMLKSLKYASVQKNNLTYLDVSNTQLISLFSGGSGLVKVNSCPNIETLDFGYSKITSLEILNCPNLVSLNISGTSNLETLSLSDIAYNKLKEVYALDSKVLCEIPNGFPIDNSNFIFYYEQRYSYRYEYNDEGEQVLVPIDKGYGWYYPGEPTSGKHSR